MFNNYIYNDTDIDVIKFEIKEDRIEVFYANGTSEIIKKTPENQEKLLAKMTSQVPKFKKYISKTKKELIKHLIFLSIDMLGVINFSIMFFNVSGWISIAIVMLLQALTLSGVFISGLSAWSAQKKHTALSSEFEKFNIWLENQILLEKNISAVNIVDPTNIVGEHSLDKNININVVDSLSLAELKKLLLICQKVEFSNDLEHFTQEQGNQKTLGTMPGSDIEN